MFSGPHPAEHPLTRILQNKPELWVIIAQIFYFVGRQIVPPVSLARLTRRVLPSKVEKHTGRCEDPEEQHTKSSPESSTESGSFGWEVYKARDNTRYVAESNLRWPR